VSHVDVLRTGDAVVEPPARPERVDAGADVTEAERAVTGRFVGTLPTNPDRPGVRFARAERDRIGLVGARPVRGYLSFARSEIPPF
jgi:hypothetical protein